jgi:hypothetical protein
VILEIAHLTVTHFAYKVTTEITATHGKEAVMWISKGKWTTAVLSVILILMLSGCTGGNDKDSAETQTPIETGDADNTIITKKPVQASGSAQVFQVEVKPGERVEPEKNPGADKSSALTSQSTATKSGQEQTQKKKSEAKQKPAKKKKSKPKSKSPKKVFVVCNCGAKFGNSAKWQTHYNSYKKAAKDYSAKYSGMFPSNTEADEYARLVNEWHRHDGWKTSDA